MANTQVKSPIIYYGGKTGLLPHLRSMDPVGQYDNYYEGFFGGGAFFWDKDPVKNETINDKLDIVINFYRVLRTRFTELKQLVDATLIARTIHYEALNCIRMHKEKPGIVAPVRLAWAFWVCTNFAYSNKIGGGYKYSNHMTVSVPQTLRKRKQEFTDRLVARIENAYIENDDAIKIARSRNTKTTFNYFDPPYAGADQGHYAGYGWDEYEALLQYCAVECKGKFLLSNYNSELLNRYVREYGWFKKEITHRISGSKSSNFRRNREVKTEVLVSNYSTPCGTLKLF